MLENNNAPAKAKSVNAAAGALIGVDGLAALKDIAEGGQLDLCNELEVE